MASQTEVVERLTADVRTLVRDELETARRAAIATGRKAGLFGGAGVFALYGVAALIFTVGALLALAIPAWAAALITTVAVLAIAGVAALVGRAQVKRAVPPEPIEAMNSGRRDVEAVKDAIRGGGRHEHRNDYPAGGRGA
jgi:membrane protein implicated in regulation of membrane protease activity